MSRSFPYPPPGYVKKGVDRSLIESIKLFGPGIDKPSGAVKLQKDVEKAKKERKKEKRREKKEKKKRAREDKSSRVTDTNHPPKKRQKNESSHVNEYPDKRLDVEQLEKSGLTEEHGKPVRVNRGASSDSTDSTQSSSCQTRSSDAFPSVPLHAKIQGNGLRIRLPLMKPREQEPSIQEAQKQCPSAALKSPKIIPLQTPVKDQWQPNDSKCSSRLIDQKSPVRETGGRHPVHIHKIWKPSSSTYDETPVPVVTTKVTPLQAPVKDQRQTSDGKYCSGVVGQQVALRESDGKHQAQVHKILKPSSTYDRIPVAVAPIAAEGCRETASGYVSQERIKSGSSCSISGRPPAHSHPVLPTINELAPSKEGCTDKHEALESVPRPSSIDLQLSSKGGSGHNKHRTRVEKKDAKYRDVIVNWCLPLLQAEILEEDDQDWLFSSKKPCQEADQKKGTCVEVSWISSVGAPQACHLAEAETHALPYVLPF